MTESELIALIEHEEANCVSSSSGALAEQRREAMQYYYGQPYGNEVEGRSQVVTTEVKDAVEGIMPSLMAIFTSSDEIVRFEPQNQDDEEAAQQATDYINYIFSRLNNGFLVLYCLFKDALLQKNGYCKVYWENYTDASRETYEKLTDMELAMLMQDGELEIVEQTAIPDLSQPPMVMPDGSARPPLLYNVVFRRTKKYGKTCVDPTPPEEILISRHTPNELEKARFVEHRTKKTISAIREMGYEVPDDIADDTYENTNQERIARESVDDASAGDGDESMDPATREVWLREAYLHVDFDGDKIAEFRKVTLIGKKLLDNVEFDSLSVIGGTAIPIPHKHNGLSLHDLVKDIQLIKSTITRQLLDNAYVANNGRTYVLDGMVNMEDLLTSRPNGVVRMKTLGAVQRQENPLLGAPFYNLLDYFDKVKQNRIGATDFPNAVDPDAINAKATFVDAYKNAALERINLMARILAETVVKQIFWKILELESKHQNKPRVVKLRGRWVNVDPREWANKFNMTVTVGLGTGSQQTTMNGAMGILQIQDALLKAGLGDTVVSPGNMYQAAKRFAKSVFPKDADAFFTDPASVPPKQPQPNPDMLKIQLAAQKAQMGDKQKRDKMALDFALELKRLGVDMTKLAMDVHMHEEDVNAERDGHAADLLQEHGEGMLDRATKIGLEKKRSEAKAATGVVQ